MPAFLLSRWTWYGLGAVVLVVALLGYRSHLINVGKVQGKEEQKQSDQQTIEQQRQLAKAQAQQAISEANAKAAEADLRAGRAEADAALYAARAQALAGQLIGSRQQVASVPQAQLQAYAVTQVQQRPMAGESSDPERAVVERVLAAPILAAQNKELAGQIGKLAESIQALKDKVAALDERDKARADYETKLEGYYVQLYNLHPPRKRAVKCLFLWRCADNKLPVPGIEAILKAKP